MVGMDVNMTEWSWDMVLKLYSSCLLANTGTKWAINKLSPHMKKQGPLCHCSIPFLILFSSFELYILQTP